MIDTDPVRRLDTKEAKDKLGKIVCSMTPGSLLIRPDDDRHGLTPREQALIAVLPIQT